MLPRLADLALPVIALAACTTARVEAPPPEAAFTVGVVPDEFPGASAVLAGFDERVAERDWRRGDTILFGVKLQKGERVERWLMRLRAKGNVDFGVIKSQWSCEITREGKVIPKVLESRMMPVEVAVFDAAGARLGDSTVALPEDFLAAGVASTIERNLAWWKTGDSTNVPDHEVEQCLRTIGGLLAFLRVVQDDAVLSERFWQVVEKPSVWSVLTSFGVTATAHFDFQRSVVATNLPAHLPPPPSAAYVAPIDIDVNGAPALFANVLAVDAARPYSLCAGVVAATARHPTRTDLHFDLLLLAARCGDPASKQ